MKNRLFWAQALLLGLAACAGAPSHTGHHGNHGQGARDGGSEGLVHWNTLAEAKQLAWVQEKPMLVEFYAPVGCGRCERMDAEVYGNEAIARQINEDFVPARIDLTGHMTREEIALGRKYDYKIDCLLLFLDHEGNVIEDAGGGRMCFADYVDPQWFSEYLSAAKAKAVEQ